MRVKRLLMILAAIVPFFLTGCYTQVYMRSNPYDNTGNEGYGYGYDNQNSYTDTSYVDSTYANNGNTINNNYYGENPYYYNQSPYYYGQSPYYYGSSPYYYDSWDNWSPFFLGLAFGYGYYNPFAYWNYYPTLYNPYYYGYYSPYGYYPYRYYSYGSHYYKQRSRQTALLRNNNGLRSFGGRASVSGGAAGTLNKANNSQRTRSINYDRRIIRSFENNGRATRSESGRRSVTPRVVGHDNSRNSQIHPPTRMSKRTASYPHYNNNRSAQRSSSHYYRPPQQNTNRSHYSRPSGGQRTYYSPPARSYSPPRESVRSSGGSRGRRR